MAIVSINKRLNAILSKSDTMGYYTGIAKLDEAIHGYQKGQVITIAASSDVGKTSFMTDGIIAVAKQVSVGVFSLEMGTKLVVERAVYNIAGLNYHRCKKSKTKAEQGLIEKAKLELANYHDIFFAENCDCMYPEYTLSQKQPEDSIELAMATMYEQGVRAFFLDYIQLVRWGFKTESETLRLKEITNKLHRLALEYDVPIIILSQLTKESANRFTKKESSPIPTISDIRDGGYIINDSDVILLLYRPDLIKNTNKELQLLIDATENAEIIVGKNRNGPTGTLKVQFYAYCMSWTPREKNKEDLF